LGCAVFAVALGVGIGLDMSAKILVLAHGSRGDCQPFLGLCLALRRAGHDPCIFSNPDHAKLAAGCNIPHHDNGIPFKEVFQSETANEAFQRNNFLKFLDAIGAQNLKYGPVMVKRLHALLASADKPDLVVCGTQHWADGMWIYDLFKIPFVTINLSNNATPNRKAAPFGLPSACGCWNELLWRFAWGQWANGLRKGCGFELERLTGQNMKEYFPDGRDVCSALQHDDVFDGVLYMIAQSEVVVGRQPWDRPSILYTGALKMSKDTMAGDEFGGQQSDALEQFLASGAEPVYMGWGSLLSGTATEMAAFAVRTLMAAGQRGVILGGWAGLKLEGLSGEADGKQLLEYCDKNVIFVETANHEALFPRCSVIVHHGGSGTSAAGMSSGRPNIVTPILYDQFDFAKKFEELGMGFNAGHFAKVTPDKLAKLITTCLAQGGVKARAKQIGLALSKATGAQVATAAITKFLEEEVSTGKFEEAMRVSKAKRVARKSSSCFSWLALCK